jgi:HAE1 family hydrophobic/amphiphilic exporter-1
VSRAEDALRTLVIDNNRTDFWNVHLVATDDFKAEQRQIDVDAAIKNALENRLDLQVMKRNIELTQLNQQLIHDSTKPSVDFQAQYTARGSGGTQIDPNTLLPVTIGFGSVFGDSFGNHNPSWTFGLNFGYPIGQTAARVNLVRQQLQLDQLQVDQKAQEQAIIAQVRDAARQVESGWRRVVSTQKALDANAKQLEAENRKLAVGMSTTFEVLQKQQLLAAAKNSELAARIAYNQALINFDKVQKVR